MSFQSTPQDYDPIALELGTDSFGLEYYLSKFHPSHDRHIRSGTEFVERVTVSKVYDEYASFPVYYKQILPAIASAIRKRGGIPAPGEAQMEAYSSAVGGGVEAGDADVWKCTNCIPLTYHIERASYRHVFNRGSSVIRSRPSSLPPAVTFDVSPKLEDQPQLLQKNLAILPQDPEEDTKSAFFDFQLRWGSLLKNRLQVQRGDCGCQSGPLLAPGHPFHNADEPMQLWVARCSHGGRSAFSFIIILIFLLIFNFFLIIIFFFLES